MPFRNAIRFAAMMLILFTEPGIAGDTPAQSRGSCVGYGPQSPRDISRRDGSNTILRTLAPDPSSLNLCNIHVHSHAEHRGPGFTISAGHGEQGGWRCDATMELTPQDLVDPTGGRGAFEGVRPGDTIEVQWVYTSCAAKPGQGIAACWNETCANPQIRIESQVFLLVNDLNALNFFDYVHNGHMEGGRPQPLSLPTGTGRPVVYAGSTTAPGIDNRSCSPVQVTWSVRPRCARLDIRSLHFWAEQGNVFEETGAHPVRPIITREEYLSQIGAGTPRSKPMNTGSILGDFESLIVSE